MSEHTKGPWKDLADCSKYYNLLSSDYDTILTERNRLAALNKELVKTLEKVLDVSAAHRSMLGRHGFDETPVESDARAVLAKVK